MSKTKKWIRSFEVKIIEDNGTGKDRGKVVYHVCSSLYPDGMPEASTKLVTKKGLSDFKKLNQNLNHLHKSLHLSGHLPSISGRRQSFFFKKKIGKDDTTEEEVLRRQCLDLLESASQHPELYNSQVFLNFFATISSPTSSLEENFPDILDAGQANQKVLANHPPPEEETTPIEMKSVSKPESEELPNYLNKAAEMIKKATECESEERFDESVACYRKAIGTLLTSLPKDKCLHRQASVKRRIAQYISKAEILTKLASSGTITKAVKGFPHLDLFGGSDFKDLQRYRIEGLVGGKVIVATDSKQNNLKVVIKVVPKTSFNTKSVKKSLLPINVKHMVTLQRYFENDDELILVLDYIAPGRLFDLIQPYLRERSMQSLTPPMLPLPLPTLDPKVKARQANNEDETDIEDLEVVCTLPSPEEDEEEELLCLSKSGIEKIHCYDYEKRQKERFEMLDDHTNEIIKKLNVFHTISPAPYPHHQYLTSSQPGRLQTPASAMSSALSTPAPVSPTSSPNPDSFQLLCDIIPTFGGHELSCCKTLPIGLIRVWSVQLIKAIMNLHSLDIKTLDLNPDNLLLNENGQLNLTYQFQWVSIDDPINTKALDKMYCAPEILVSKTTTTEADWWSVGVLLFELLTGSSFYQIFPSGLMPHTPLYWTLDEQKSNDEETDLKDLIANLVQTNPQMRLTSKQIKEHRFFRGVNWDS